MHYDKVLRLTPEGSSGNAKKTLGTWEKSDESIYKLTSNVIGE